MTKQMVYYLAWQEDEWLDEFLDRFPNVNALVPTVKSLEQIKAQRAGEGDRILLVINPSGEPQLTRELLRKLSEDEALSREPLYLVGVRPDEAAEWQAASPHARVVVMDKPSYEFDFDNVLDRMEAEWEEQV